MNRNDPCPCGSGRKYKKCHGAPSATGPDVGTRSLVRRSEIARASACKTIDVQLHDEMMAWAIKHLGRAWLQQAIRNFSWDDSPDIAPAEMMMFGTWLQYHMPISETDPMSLASRYREAARLHREPAKERVLNAQLEAPIGIWEVQSIERGVGSQVKDLLSGDERFIYDAASTETLEPWLSMLGYVVECDGVCFMGGVYYQPLPPSYVDDIVRATRKAARVRTKPVPIEFRVSPDWQLELIDQWRDAIEGMIAVNEHRVMNNTDGDEISIHADRFDVTVSRDEILRRLATIPGAEPPEQDGPKDMIAVLRVGGAKTPASPPTMGNTVVGSMVLSGSTLTAETNSTKRADTLKAAIERAAGDAVRFRLRSTESMESIKTRARSPGPGGPTSSTPASGKFFTSESPDMPPEVREAMRQMMAKLDAQWVDSQIPALGDMTPRAAVRDAKMRPVLERLLKDMESRGAPTGAGMGMDIAAIRRMLGV